jgi:hypothetical protein
LPRPQPLVSGIKTKECDALPVARFRLLLTPNGHGMKALSRGMDELGKLLSRHGAI